MNRLIYLTITLVAAAGTAACGAQSASTSANAIAVRVAATQTSEAPAPAAGPGELTGAGAGASPAPTASRPASPAPSPTVAKVQKRVKIFSGPSTTDITPPKSKTVGSHTVELNATESSQIGTYLADGAGRTLYRFDNDSADPPKSTCNGDCATAWPPLLIKSPGKIFPKGVDPKIIGYVERADHSCQVTVNGHPVYYFVADAKAGDINGQGVNGKWFAVAPDGGKTKAISAFPSPTK
jgi:predicted lipoprotein with Yx(FWY)xxD motif